MQQGYPVIAQPTNFQTSNTTVVVNQPAPIVFQQGMRDWSSDLCGCCEDCYSCELNNFKVSRKRKGSQNKRKEEKSSASVIDFSCPYAFGDYFTLVPRSLSSLGFTEMNTL